jgi:hypothetical protein
MPEKRYHIKKIAGYLSDTDEVRVSWTGYGEEDDTYFDRQILCDEITWDVFVVLWKAYEESIKLPMQAIVGYFKEQFKITFTYGGPEDDMYFTEQDLTIAVGQDRSDELQKAWKVLQESADSGSDIDSDSESGSAMCGSESGSENWLEEVDPSDPDYKP